MAKMIKTLFGVVCLAGVACACSGEGFSTEDGGGGGAAEVGEDGDGGASGAGGDVGVDAEADVEEDAGCSCVCETTTEECAPPNTQGAVTCGQGSAVDFPVCCECEPGCDLGCFGGSLRGDSTWWCCS